MRKSSRQTSYLNLELTQGLSARSNSIHHAFITLTSNQIDKWVCIYVMDNGLCYLHKTANWGSIRYGSKKFKCHFGWFLLSPHSHKKKILRVWGSWWNQINYQKGIIYQIVFLFCQYIQEDRSVKSDCLLYSPVRASRSFNLNTNRFLWEHNQCSFEIAGLTQEDLYHGLSMWKTNSLRDPEHISKAMNSSCRCHICLHIIVKLE